MDMSMFDKLKDLKAKQLKVTKLLIPKRQKQSNEGRIES
jgi:hypothetical protein